MTDPVPPSTSRRLRRLVLALALMAGSAGVAATPAAAVAPGPKPVDATSFYANLQGMSLKDQEGRPFQPAQLKGRVVLAHFIFTGCSTVCPVQTRALAELQGQLPPALKPRVHFLSISLDPLSDTPQVLKQFALRMQADLGRWSFITGKPEQIEQLGDKLRLFRPGPDVRKPDDHSTALWLIDASGQLRMRYSGNAPDLPRLLKEIGIVAQMK